MSEEAKWYVAHTYSGYENKVKANIEKTIENRRLHDQILEVCVPMQDVEEETPGGKKKIVARKVFPGYVLVHMVMNDDTWYVVRNSRGVTSFVGPGSKPVPLTDQEVKSMGVISLKEEIDIFVDDSCTVTAGPFAGSIGIVNKVNESKRTVSLLLDGFRRETPVELGFDEIKKN